MEGGVLIVLEYIDSFSTPICEDELLGFPKIMEVYPRYTRRQKKEGEDFDRF